MINKSLVDELDSLGFGSDVDKLENYVASISESIKIGKAMESIKRHALYKDLLENVKPDSKVLIENESNTDKCLYDSDKLLKEYKMGNILSVKSMKDLIDFKENILSDKAIDLIAISKINGYPVRVVYKNGSLLSGSTKGNNGKGVDITRQLKEVLPIYIEDFKNYGLIEIRGDAVVSLEDFNEVRHTWKTPLSCSALLLRDGVTTEELKMLNVICYRCITEKDSFDTQEEELEFLEEHDFSVPDREVFSGVDYYSFDMRIEEILNKFETMYDNEELMYDTDGIIVSINDNKTFYSKGLRADKYNGNFALKMGKVWENSNIYESKVEDIKWIYDTKYIRPLLKIEEILTVTGIEVNEVELNSIDELLTNNIKVGSSIKVEYNGINGVSLIGKEK